MSCYYLVMTNTLPLVQSSTKVCLRIRIDMNGLQMKRLKYACWILTIQHSNLEMHEADFTNFEPSKIQLRKYVHSYKLHRRKERNKKEMYLAETPSIEFQGCHWRDSISRHPVEFQLVDFIVIDLLWLSKGQYDLNWPKFEKRYIIFNLCHSI